MDVELNDVDGDEEEAAAAARRLAGWLGWLTDVVYM